MKPACCKIHDERVQAQSGCRNRKKFQRGFEVVAVALEGKVVIQEVIGDTTGDKANMSPNEIILRDVTRRN